MSLRIFTCSMETIPENIAFGIAPEKIDPEALKEAAERRADSRLYRAGAATGISDHGRREGVRLWIIRDRE